MFDHALAQSYGFPRPRMAQGRRPSSECPRQRRRHIRCAYFRLVENRPVRWIAARFRVSIRTVSLWVASALRYDDPEAIAVRRQAGA